MNKLAGKLAGFTALNNLAFNALQATNQLLIDNVRLIEEGVSGQFFGKADLAWAKSQFHLSLQGVGQLKDFQAFAPKSKIGQAILYFDALSDVTSSIYKDKSGPKSLRALKDAPMILQGIAENETAVTRMLAMMKAYEAKDHTVSKTETLAGIASKYGVTVDGIKKWNNLQDDKITEGQVLKVGKLVDENGDLIKTADGNFANLWDVFILDEKTGRYSIDPRVKDAQKLRTQLRNRISGLTKKTNQVKNKFDDAMLQRRWYGKLIMLFRRYFVPSLRRYYGHGSVSRLGGGLHRDLELGTVSEGIIHSAFRFLKEGFQKKGNFGGVYKQLEDFEKQNVKRFGVQVGFVITCLAILSALQDDDDDDESFSEQFAIYQALRMQSELTQFVRPKEFIKMAESPTATIRTVGRATDLIDQMMIQAGGMITGDTEGMYYERRSGSHLKGDNKLLAKLEDLIPILNGISRSRNPEEASKWFNLGAGSGK
jgi:LysM repeat protein